MTAKLLNTLLVAVIISDQSRQKAVVQNAIEILLIFISMGIVLCYSCKKSGLKAIE